MMIGSRKLPTLRQRLAYARILYAIRVWTNGPQTLRNLLIAESETSDTSWWHHLRQDLEWCGELCPDSIPVQDYEPETLAKSWLLQTDQWLQTARGALRKSILQESTAAEVRAWHHCIVKTLTSHGAVIEGAPVENDGGNALAYECECGRVFGSAQELAAHRRFAHGYSAPEAKFVTGPKCPACLRFLWSKFRVKQHLAYVPRGGGPNPCYAKLVRQGYHPDLEEETLIDPATNGINRRDALQTAGPQQRSDYDALEEEIQYIKTQLADEELRFATYYGVEGVCLRYAEEMSRAFTAATWEWFQVGASKDATEERAVTTLQDLWLVATAPGPRDADHEVVFVHWGRDVLPDLVSQWEDGRAEKIAEDAFYGIVRECGYVEAEDRIAILRRRLRGASKDREDRGDDRPHRQVHYGPTTRRGSYRVVQKQCERFHDQDNWQKQVEGMRLVVGPGDTPLPYYKRLAARPVFLVAHLFSGRRRQEDFHYWLAKFTADQPFNCHILSLDTAVDGAIVIKCVMGQVYRPAESRSRGVRAARSWVLRQKATPGYQQPGSYKDRLQCQRTANCQLAQFPRSERGQTPWPGTIAQWSWPTSFATLARLRFTASFATLTRLRFTLRILMIFWLIMACLRPCLTRGACRRDEWKAALFRVAIIRLLLQNCRRRSSKPSLKEIGVQNQQSRRHCWTSGCRNYMCQCCGGEIRPHSQNALWLLAGQPVDTALRCWKNILPSFQQDSPKEYLILWSVESNEEILRLRRLLVHAKSGLLQPWMSVQRFRLVHPCSPTTSHSGMRISFTLQDAFGTNMIGCCVSIHLRLQRANNALKP